MDTNFISSISPKELQGDELARLFVNGAKAVMVRDDDRIHRLVDAILEWFGADEPHSASLQSPFGKNLLNLARNHIAGNRLLGDILRFEPGRIVHTARKFIVYGSAIDQSLRTFPDRFYVGNHCALVPCMIKELVSNLMSEIFSSSFPWSHSFHSSYAIEVEVLTYPGSRSDVEAIGNTLADSFGRWSRWGYLIDAYRNNAYGIFDVKIIRDFYALCSLLPGIGRLLRFLNTRMAVARTGPLPDDYFLLGRPHVDDGRYITALTGCRENLHTQILGAGAWIPLEVSPNALAIFPSQRITQSSAIPATYHRILLYDPPGNGNLAVRNISLSLSIIDRPKHLN
jgi:hypothetical protein